MFGEMDGHGRRPSSSCPSARTCHHRIHRRSLRASSSLAGSHERGDGPCTRRTARCDHQVRTARQGRRPCRPGAPSRTPPFGRRELFEIGRPGRRAGDSERHCGGVGRLSARRHPALRALHDPSNVHVCRVDPAAGRLRDLGQPIGVDSTRLGGPRAPRRGARFPWVPEIGAVAGSLGFAGPRQPDQASRHDGELRR